MTVTKAPVIFKGKANKPTETLEENAMKCYKTIKGDIYDRETGYCTVLEELVTERERMRYFPNIPNEAFECVNISKSKAYFLFGARFELEDV